MSFNLDQMQSLLGQAKRQYEVLREKMSQTTVEASAGAGMVWVRMNGDKQLLEIKLDPETVKNDPDMLPDLIIAAVNDAARQVDERLKSELGGMMGGMMGGMPLPGMF